MQDHAKRFLSRFRLHHLSQSTTSSDTSQADRQQSADIMACYSSISGSCAWTKLNLWILQPQNQSSTTDAKLFNSCNFL